MMDATDSEDGAGLPSELKERLATFDDSITQLERIIEPLLSVPRNELFEKLPPLDQAKVDIMSVYGLNSLFWMYLNTCGENPKSHAVKQELDRIRGYMGRVKEIQDKALAPKLDQKTSKRFVKSALWQAAHKTPEHDKSKEDPATPKLSKEEEMKADLQLKLAQEVKGGKRYYKGPGGMKKRQRTEKSEDGAT